MNKLQNTDERVGKSNEKGIFPMGRKEYMINRRETEEGISGIKENQGVAYIQGRYVHKEEISFEGNRARK